MQFGRLCLSSDGGTNSTLSMPDGISIVNFADSSSGRLVQRGESRSGQLERRLFRRRAAANYFWEQCQRVDGRPTRANSISQSRRRPGGNLSGENAPTGELVPKAGGAAGDLALHPQPAGMQVQLQGEIGSTYSIETSTDLVHWCRGRTKWIRRHDYFNRHRRDELSRAVLSRAADYLPRDRARPSVCAPHEVGIGARAGD